VNDDFRYDLPDGIPVHGQSAPRARCPCAPTSERTQVCCVRGGAQAKRNGHAVTTP
jgi:hypothetical protein